MITITITLGLLITLKFSYKIVILYIVLTFKVVKEIGSLQFYTYIMPCPILLFLK